MRKSSERLKVPVTVSLDHEYLSKFNELNKGQLSAQINAMLKDYVDHQKNEEAQECDPLSLKHRQSGSARLVINKERQMTLFENFDVLSKYVHSIDDVPKLAKIEKQGKVLHDLARTRKMRILNGGLLTSHQRQPQAR